MWWRGAERSCPEQPHPPAALVSHGGLGCHRAVSSLLKWYDDVCWRLYAIIRGHRCTSLCVVLSCHRGLFFVFSTCFLLACCAFILCTRAFPCFYVSAFYWCVVPFCLSENVFLSSLPAFNSLCVVLLYVCIVMHTTSTHAISSVRACRSCHLLSLRVFVVSVMSSLP